MTAERYGVQIKLERGYLDGTVLAPKTAVPGVLFVHGWGGSQEQYLERARQAVALGCICLTFDLTGHGRTQDEQQNVTRETNLQDLLAAYDALVAHPSIDREAIAVVGSSYGGYLATILTELRPVRWLGLRVPALYLDDGWNTPKRALHVEHDLVAYRKRIVASSDNRALRAAARFGGDVLLVESEHDKIVPHPAIASYLQAFLNAHSLTYRIIAGADHGLSDDASQRAYTSLLVNWLTEMVAGQRAGDRGGAPH
ncbi:alpha/beta hydrolase family protein [Paraburkholderia phenoliruptrix]|uniref:Alpha/beta hydrolase fold protein n=2 Tax=Paraburkholderia phenoliruptrix TaxID=252970 RepID=K0DTG8_9BURK|nr:alpha/beta fold hydrolase [Paraburkholderia phenoliruptrix]AFT89526.1 alpha/beta hydrolase fold protein [Paraburkholderia phenoliruptrix BR3459a]MDR6423858.1 pimeloyl-ACP methyl ester carboxylesterase [Paraburkholderia phenoliruptrix]WMY10365.1 alpha/beta fold hydrolase [Paraburkholderia phenoliruptrix]CAB4050528.1 2-succinyl-6-hydroxy-2, 4-cyclohexadiene-1-carboxylate synthase [Paraburkholderia phenoliruptrix]